MSFGVYIEAPGGAKDLGAREDVMAILGRSLPGLTWTEEPSDYDEMAEEAPELMEAMGDSLAELRAAAKEAAAGA